MISKEYIELINKDIDKLITPQEKEKLQNYLLTNPEAKNYYEDLQLLSAYIEKIPEPAPPAGLSQRIINSVNFNQHSIETRESFTHSFSFNKIKMWIPRLGYLAIGMFVGFFIYALINDESSINKDDIKGTIGLENKRMENVKTVKIDNRDITGTVNLMKSGESFWFDVDLNSVKPFELDIKYQDEVELVDFSPNTLSFTKNGNSLEIDKSAGSQHFTVYFSKTNNSAILNIQISQGGSVLIKEKFQIN